MKAKEAIEIFEYAKQKEYCTSIRGFAKMAQVVPSTVIFWRDNPEREVDGNISIRLNYLKEEFERKESEYVDWCAFRREAAKDILCAYISTRKNADIMDMEGWAKSAICFANELIRQLREL